MKVCFLLPHLRVGGIERLFLYLAREFVAAGVECDVVLQEAVGELLAEVPPEVCIVALRQSRVIKAIPAILRYLSRARPDAVFTGMWPHNAIAVIAAYATGGRTRTIVGVHNNFSGQVRARGGGFRLAPIAYRFLLPRADAVVAVSNGVADDLARSIGIDRAGITVIYNPVLPSDLDEKIAVDPCHPWLTPDSACPVVVSAGRLVAQKNFGLLIKAFARLRSGRPARLIVLGSGSLEGELRLLAKELGVAEDVDFTGSVDNPFSYIARARVFALSSSFEGFGNVLVEALSCGTQVVSADCPFGPAEILDHGRYGRLVQLDDVAGFADALELALDQPLPKDALADRASELSGSNAFKAYGDLLRSVVGQGLHGSSAVSL